MISPALLRTWIRPWIVFQANVMPSAEQLERWRPQLRFRPLLTGNAEQLPTRELREAAIYAYGELADIQLDHASE